MLATWRLTVCGLRSKARAISLLLSPAAMRLSTSSSRGLSARRRRTGGGRRSRARRCCRRRPGGRDGAAAIAGSSAAQRRSVAIPAAGRRPSHGARRARAGRGRRRVSTPRRAAVGGSRTPARSRPRRRRRDRDGRPARGAGAPRRLAEHAERIGVAERLGVGGDRASRGRRRARRASVQRGACRSRRIVSIAAADRPAAGRARRARRAVVVPVGEAHREQAVERVDGRVAPVAAARVVEEDEDLVERAVALGAPAEHREQDGRTP